MQINKIGLIISWPREIDIFSEFLKLNSSKIDFIVNDNLSFEKGRNFSNKKIIEILKKKKINFKYFSNIYKKQKYKVIISTGEFSGYHINFYSIFRFFYGITIGTLLDFFGISKFLIKKFGRSFTADGIKSRLGISFFPEKKIGEIVIKFPDGIDIKKKNYPYDFYKNIFDIFFAYSDFEINLINNKFKDKISKKIEYFRFNNFQKKEGENFHQIFHNFDKSKKTIYWLPTHIDNGKDEDKNLLDWIFKLNFLNKYFNVILRPHPKSVSRNKDLIVKIEKLDYFLDTDFDKNLGEAIINADLIFADYGGVVFDTIHLEKKILLLDMDESTSFVKTLKEIDSVDIEIRKNLNSLVVGDNEEEIIKKLKNTLNSESNTITKLKNDYYGDKKPLSFLETFKYLENLL